MFELEGKYNKCKVFTDNADNATVSQLISLMNQESVNGSKIRIMPDTHAGKGCVIGTTMTITDKIIPNLVGVDIGCFTGDTKVWCAAGYYKTIKELAESGKEFLTDSWDVKQKTFIGTYATAFKTRENAELVEVRYNGSYKKFDANKDVKVRCTPDHKFLVCKNKDKDYDESDLEWVEAKDLKEGMKLVAEDLFVIVKGVKKLYEREDVYCLNVPVYHNFSIYLGVIVHNCGMHTVKLKEKKIDLPKLDNVIKKYVPAGGEIHEKPGKYANKIDVRNLRCFGNSKVSDMIAEYSIGTLGGGNHFIEVDKDDEGNLYLVIHTGSRRVGKDVAEYYQNAAYDELNCKGAKYKELEKEARKEYIEQVKKEGKQKDLNKLLAKWKWSGPASDSVKNVPYELSYCEGELFDDYIHDMKIVQEYSYWNRKSIADTILKEMKLHSEEEFETIHNYIDTENMILRKGAVSAAENEILLIPINMRDGSLICVGKGNEDWNCSAPHGAGRLMSRKKAKESISMTDFKNTMKEAGIYTTSVNKGTIDESPFAYKPMEEIINNVKDSVDIIKVIKPIYNFKAGADED